MPSLNYTPIDDLIKNHNQKSNQISHVKEFEPPSRKHIEIQEVVEHEEKDEEVNKHIEVRKETVEIPQDLQQLGIRSNGTTNFPSYSTVHLPLSDEKVILGLNQPITSSARWLATFALYILKQAHATLKVIHGKVVRERLS